jgi:cytochrome oxidase Cu insertion factor (SCO1/SenC/PrrC family)
MRYRSLAVMAVLAVVALVGATACTSTGGNGQGGQALGPAPAFDLETLAGPRLTSEGLKGKPTLLTFGASW